MKERGLLLPPRVCPDGRARERPGLLQNFPRAGKVPMGLWGQRGQGGLVLSIGWPFQLFFSLPWTVCGNINQSLQQLLTVTTIKMP